MLLAHTSQFAQIGWKYLKHGSGVGHLAGGGSYVTLASPDMKDFTMVIETMVRITLCIHVINVKHTLKVCTYYTYFDNKNCVMNIKQEESYRNKSNL